METIALRESAKSWAEHLSGSPKRTNPPRRAAVVLYCVRSDLIGRESLEDLAFSLHYTESEVDNLVTNFCHAINWR